MTERSYFYTLLDDTRGSGACTDCFDKWFPDGDPFEGLDELASARHWGKVVEILKYAAGDDRYAPALMYARGAHLEFARGADFVEWLEAYASMRRKISGFIARLNDDPLRFSGSDLATDLQALLDDEQS